MPNFDGAELYDSYAASFDRQDNADMTCERVIDDEDPTDIDMVPRTFNCAIKDVFASLWNKRAIEERSFARLDHAQAKMGLAVIQRYKNVGRIAANSVVITRVVNAQSRTLGVLSHCHRVLTLSASGCRARASL